MRGHGKHGKVGSVRVGNAKLGGPGTLPMAGGGVNKQPLKPSNSQSAGFKIFSDENAPAGGSTSGPGVGGRQNIPSRVDSKENEMTAGPWTKARVATNLLVTVLIDSLT